MRCIVVKETPEYFVLKELHNSDMRENWEGWTSGLTWDMDNMTFNGHHFRISGQVEFLFWKNRDVISRLRIPTWWYSDKVDFVTSVDVAAQVAQDMELGRKMAHALIE